METAVPEACGFDYDLVAGVGQPVECAVAQYGIVKEVQLFLHGLVAGDDEAGRPMAVGDHLRPPGDLRLRQPEHILIATGSPAPS